ncbi:MAG: 30S ribosomal protein S21 [Candidatus Edwardsbacteria bacterium]
MVSIRVKEEESLESALRRFKKNVEREGILTDIKKHQQFEKPSERKKRKKMQAQRRVQRGG